MKKLKALMKQNDFLKLKNEEEIKLCIYRSLIYPELKEIYLEEEFEEDDFPFSLNIPVEKFLEIDPQSITNLIQLEELISTYDFNDADYLRLLNGIEEVSEEIEEISDEYDDVKKVKYTYHFLFKADCGKDVLLKIVGVSQDDDYPIYEEIESI